MNVLFVHQNFPGQYKHLAPALAEDRRNTVKAIGEKKNLGRLKHPKVEEITYDTPRAASQSTHHYLHNLENGVRRGQTVCRLALEMKKNGFSPDVICSNPSWGEGLFLRDVWPDAKLLYLFEFFYSATGQDMGFDPEFPQTFDDVLRVRIKNCVQILSLNACDWGIAPTRWQYSTLPPEYRSKCSVVHEGIDTDFVKPNPDAFVKLRSGATLTREDEVVTYVARNMEPYRGFHTFMRTVPIIQKRRPNARILVVGADDVSYGSKPKGADTYRDLYLKEQEGKIDFSRIHFVGRVPYMVFLNVLQISSAHIYLTYPFVLSWSMLESMACGCLVIGSRTPPVQEVITHNKNGLLVDFFKPMAIADAVDRALDNRAKMEPLREAARRTVVENFDLKTVCLPEQLRLVKTLAAGKTPKPEAA